MNQKIGHTMEDLPVLRECAPGGAAETYMCPGVFQIDVLPGWLVRGREREEYELQPSDGRDMGISITVLPVGRGNFVDRAMSNILASAGRVGLSEAEVNVTIGSDGREVAARYVDGEREWYANTLRVGAQVVLLTGVAPIEAPDWLEEMLQVGGSLRSAPAVARSWWRRGLHR